MPSTTLYAAGLVGMGLVSFVFWNAPTVTTATWVYVVLFSLSGFPGAALSVGMVTTVQTASPRHALGRISGMFNTADALGTALGSILAGALIDHLALRPLLDVQSGIYLTGGIAAFVLLRRHNSFSASSRNSSGTPPRPPSATDA